MVGSKGAGTTRADATRSVSPRSDSARSGASAPSEYFPGLDGLRAIAVVAVLLFHAGIADAGGGFLGVSLFFTLSGFLITGLLIRESAGTGRISLRRFWGRRIRRLMPAALLCLGLVVAGARWLVARPVLPRLRLDVVAAATNVANWRFVTAHQSYAELFAHQPSAVLHFWSLAIEEQFYLVFPCIAALLLSRRRTWALPVGLAVLIAASVTASVMTGSHDVVYYGTHTRAAELLIGGLLACVVHRRAGVHAERRHVPWSPAWVVQLAGFAALGALVVLVATTEQSDGWLYEGGFAGLALLWCALVIAARTPGPFRALVSRRPLVALGRRSYGVYLYHWPVFTLLTPARLGVHGWQARLIQLLVIAAVTEASYRVVERPVRLRRILTNARRAPAVALGCVAAVIASALVLPSSFASTAGAQVSMVDAPDEVVHLSPATPPGSDDGANAAASPDVSTTTTSTPSSPPSTPPETTPAVVAAGDGAAVMVVSGQGSAPPPTVAPSVPALDVAVIGDSPELVSHLQSLRAGGADIALDDLTVAGCSVVAMTGDDVGDGTCVPAPSDRAPIDVLVIAIGAVDHQTIADAVAIIPGKAGLDIFDIVQHVQQSAVAEFERLGRRAGNVVLVDTVPDGGSPTPSPDVLDTIIDEAVLSTPSLSHIELGDLTPAAINASPAAASTTGTDASMPPSVADAAAPDAPMKVMVIGDSTSYGIAQGLARSTAGGFDVLWAGKRNCPLARMESIRWLTGDEFSMADCPSVESVWPAQIDSFRPTVVLVVDGLPEQSLQRYAGDSDWHAAGDAQFVAIHDADFRALLGLVAKVGAVVVLAGQPHNADGAVAWAPTQNIDAWNAQLSAWDAQWAPVATWPYGQAVEAAESAAGHSLRPDGLHLDEQSVDAIVGGVLAPQLRAQVVDLRAALAASGCLIEPSVLDAQHPGQLAAQLDLTRCG